MAILLISSLHLLCHASTGAAAPARNATRLHTVYAPQWVPDPSARGTWSLLYSCLFTLGLCVWSAIHLNIPPRGEPAIEQFLRKTKWVLLAVFAPEFVLFSAWQQLYNAQDFCKRVKRISQLQATQSTETVHNVQGSERSATDSREKPREGEERARKTPAMQESEDVDTANEYKENDLEAASGPGLDCSLTFAFYALMGGFTIDVSDIYDSVQALTLTRDGLLHFLRQGWMTTKEISDRDIRDKSKADYLGKGLVLLQVTWMFLQCISRKASGLPLSVLEIHTLVHAGCALIMYCMWWKKPLDIRDASMIPTSAFTDELAFLVVNSPETCRPPFRRLAWPGHFPRVTDTNNHLFPNFDEVTEAAFLAYGPNIPTQVDAQLTRRTEGNGEAVRSARRQTPIQDILISPPTNVTIERTLTTGQTLAAGVGPSSCPISRRPVKRRALLSLFRRQRDTACLPPSKAPLVMDRLLPRIKMSYRDKDAIYCRISMHLSAKDVIRLNRCGQALNRLHPSRNTRHRSCERLEPPPETLFVLRSRNVSLESSIDLLGEGLTFDSRSSAVMSLSLLGLGTLYAGTHLALWEVEFPTRVEGLLWKIAACALAGLPALYLVLLAVFLSIYAPVDAVTRLSDPSKEPRKTLSDCYLKWLVLCYFLHPCHILHRAICGTLRGISNPFVYLSTIFVSSYWHVRNFIDPMAYGHDVEGIVIIIVIMVGFLVVIVLGGAAAILYILARLFIVAESFLSLRKVPVGVYEGVNWAQYIPHL